MNKIIVKYRNTGHTLNIRNKRDIIYKVYSSVSTLWNLYSPFMGYTLEKYKDVPITEHKMTDSERRKLKNNPDYINDIPKYEVRGYDKEVSNSRMDRMLSLEFYFLFLDGSKTVIDFINKFHPDFYVELEEN